MKINSYKIFKSSYIVMLCITVLMSLCWAYFKLVVGSVNYTLEIVTALFVVISITLTVLDVRVIHYLFSKDIDNKQEDN